MILNIQSTPVSLINVQDGVSVQVGNFIQFLVILRVQILLVGAQAISSYEIMKWLVIAKVSIDPSNSNEIDAVNIDLRKK